jgi:phosphoserine aminotransferase
MARADANAKVLYDWAAKTPWLAPLAEVEATRSNTSVCLKITDPAVAKLPIDAQRAFVKQIESILDKENAARDIAGHRDAPPHLRIWCGATVDTADLEALTHWLDWAFAEAKASLAKAA